MANTRGGNVIVVDTSAAFVDAKSIKAIKYVGSASGTASLKVDGTSGNVVWEEAGESNVFNEVNLSNSGGFYVTVTNSAKVYLYLA